MSKLAASSTISIVTSSKDRQSDVVLLLKSLASQSLKPIEVIIVDSSRNDSSRERLADFERETGIHGVYIHNPRATLARARNLGLSLSMGELVTYVDDDAVLDEHYLEEIAKLFAADTGHRIAGATGERITRLDGSAGKLTTGGPLLNAYTFFAKAFLLVHYGNGELLPSGHPTIIRPGSISVPVRVAYLVGANMSFRRDVLKKLRFDEDLPYFDDNDISFRVGMDYQLAYVPSAKFVHFFAKGGQGRGMERCRKEVHYYLLFREKNFPPTLRNILLSYWASMGFYLRASMARLLRPVLKNHITTY